MNAMKTTYAFVATAALFAVGCSAADPALGGASDEVTTSCPQSACGPQLGLANWVCWDGSIGGPTGQCISTTQDPACHWEVRQCPPQTCTPSDCGVEPMIEVNCFGNIEKPICESVNGKCEWQVPVCVPQATPYKLPTFVTPVKTN